MTKLIVDGKEIDVAPDCTLLQACEAAGAEIPRFCFHARLSIAGNCRMCLVEVAGMPKPQASCAMAVKDLPPNRDGTPKVISTRSPMVRKARVEAEARDLRAGGLAGLQQRVVRRDIDLFAVDDDLGHLKPQTAPNHPRAAASSRR